MMKLVSLILLVTGLLGGLVTGNEVSRTDLPELFLVEFFTIEGHAEEIPMEERADYLEERFGLYCCEEALEDMLSSRLPFSLMAEASDQEFDLRVVKVEIESHEPVNEEADIKVNYRVSARRESFSGDSQEKEITGRLTLDREDGRIRSIRVDNLDKLLEE